MDNAIEIRRERGLRIASAKRIKAVGPCWVVPSESHAGSYVVREEKGEAACTCPDYELRRAPCKHVFAVEYARHQVTHPDGTKVVTETLRVTYGQNWSAYNAGQVNEKDLVQSLLKGLCAGIVVPEQSGRGRPRLPLGDVVYAATMKVYGGMSGRRTSTSIREAEARGDIEHAPHYNSISAYLEKPELTPILKALIVESALPLKAVETAFAMRVSGISCYLRQAGRRPSKKMSRCAIAALQ
jgi:hypothetical protein